MCEDKISEEKIEEFRKEIFNDTIKYKYKTYNKDETVEQYVNRLLEYKLLILTTDMNFLTIVNEVRSKYNYVVKMSQPEKDIMQTLFKHISKSMNISIDEIKKRYVESYEEVEERMMYRLELYKAGWSIFQIEKYISKFLIKEEMFRIDLYRYERLYYNFYRKLSLQINTNLDNKKIGRPSLPKVLKEYNKYKHSKKTKINMKIKYKNNDKYNEIRQHFFTNEEEEKIKEYIQDKKILEKVSKLKIC